MKHDSASVGELVKRTRKALGLTQASLAMASGTGLRFIIELEKGKPTCQLQKTLTVLNTLGVKMLLEPPVPVKGQGHGGNARGQESGIRGQRQE